MLRNIFSVPFYSTILDKSIINDTQSKVLSKLHLLDNLEGSKNSYQKTDFFEQNQIVGPNELEELFININQHAIKFAEESNILLNLSVKYWIQNYSNNDYHQPHSHSKHDISGVYYVQADKNSGPIIFNNPNPYIIGYNSFINPKIEKDQQYLEVKPQPGLLILFPSYLVHQVVPSQNSIRTVIAFNYG